MEILSADSIPVQTTAPAPRRHSVAWVWQVTGLSLLLGVMLALALQTEFRLRPVVGRFGTRAGVAVGLKESNDRLQQEVVALRKQSSEFEKQLGHQSSSASVLAGELREVKLRAGLLPVTGPGLVITLRDSPLKPPGAPSQQDQQDLTQQLIVHDRDINMILGEC